jgi:hypothetical protein
MPLSNWKLTFDPGGTPIVLLDIGERLAEEVQWSSKRGSETIPLVDGPAPFLRDGKNVVTTISFEKTAAENAPRADTLKGVIRAMMAHSSLSKAPLRIEAEGVEDCYWQAAAATVPDLTSKLVAIRSGQGVRYTIHLTGITEVDTEDDPIPPTTPTPTDPGNFD